MCVETMFVNYQYVRQPDHDFPPRIACNFTFSVATGTRAYVRIFGLTGTGDAVTLHFGPDQDRFADVRYQPDGAPLLDVVSDEGTSVLVITLLAWKPQRIGVVLALSASDEIGKSCTFCIVDELIFRYSPLI